MRSHFLATMLIFVTTSAQWLVQVNDKKMYEKFFTEEHYARTVNRLLGEVRPANPRNAAMLPELRQQLDWFFEKRLAGVLEIQHIREKYKNPKVLMNSKYEPDGMAVIKFYAPTIIEVAVTTPDGELADLFAVMLAHEVYHLQGQNPAFYQIAKAQDVIQEEIRAWGLTCARIIRPMRAQGARFPGSLVKMDDVLARCGDDPSCPEFEAWINASYKNDGKTAIASR